MKTFRIDCSTIESYEDFIRAFNVGMIRSLGGEWNRNLDAFNDYLSWPDDVPYQISLVGSLRCEATLSYKRNPDDLKSLWSIIKEIFDDNNEILVVCFY